MLRRPLVRALDDAALKSTPEQAVQVWLLAIGIAGLVGSGLAPLVGVLGAVSVVVCGPIGLRVGRHRRERLIGAAVPDTLEQIASELRAGGTVATAIAGVARGDGVLEADANRIEPRSTSAPGSPTRCTHGRRSAGRSVSRSRPALWR